MTRLFLRFFLGVIAILIASLIVQGGVLSAGRARQTAEQAEKSFAGQLRLATRHLLTGDPNLPLTTEQFDRRVEDVKTWFDFPIELKLWWQLNLTGDEKKRLERGEVVFVSGTQMLVRRIQSDTETGNPRRTRMIVVGDSLEDVRRSDDYVLRLGPIPTVEGPSNRQIMSGFGLIMVFTALAIAILLRPVAVPLRAVERTATAIAEGDLTARIDPKLVPKGLKIASTFNAMANRTETLLRSQKELLQAVSHELRTPLARIRFATDLIETAETDEERKGRLQSVDNATQRLDDLVGELLTYVRLESDGPNDEPEQIELNSLFEQLVDMYAPLHEGVEFNIERIVPNVQVNADRRSVARAVGNLLSNAGRYAQTRVAVRAIQRSDGVLIQVDDDGVGIPEEDRDKVFDPFVRLTPGDGKGTGLGLALVQRIANRHDGTVVAEASDMGGARFSLFLPGEADEV